VYFRKIIKYPLQDIPKLLLYYSLAFIKGQINMSRFSSYRTLGFIVLIISLSSIVVMAVYFSTKEDSGHPIISQLPLPKKVEILNNPSIDDALAVLFTSAKVKDSKVKIDKDTLASFWFAQSFNDGINKYHAIFIKNQMVDESNEVYGSHADAPIISSVVYKLIENKWILASKQENIGLFGSWGDTPEVKEVEILPLAKGNFALLLDISYSGQGYTNSGKTIFAYHQDSWAQLGYLQTEGDNSGVCDDEAEEDELLSACWEFKGKISLAKDNDGSDYPDVIVNRTGTMAGENGKIIPVKNSLYSFNGEEYLEFSDGGK
jgi:hypothetical protein